MADPVKAIVIVLVVVIAILFGFCCHFASLRRREEEQNRTALQQTAVGTTGNTNQTSTSAVYIFGLQGAASNSNARARGVVSNPIAAESVRSPDVIADSGPPPYSCLATSGEPLPPPPSYEEALRA